MSTRDTAYAHLLAKARDAKRGGVESWRAMSTGEKLAVALVLDEAAWIHDAGYTLAEAIDRLEPDWLAALRPVERALQDES